MNVRVKGWEGIAFYKPMTCEDNSHDLGCEVVVMVGDDRRHHVDESDVTPLKEDEFCGGCGQIGCGHG